MRFSLRAIISACALIGVMIVLAPSVAHAADWIPIVQCGGETPCTPCDLFESFKRFIDFILEGVTGPIAAFMIVFSGGMMLLGGGKPDLYGQGKKMLTNTLYGVGIILIAWIATNFLIRALMPGVSEGSTWFEFSCPASLSAIEPIETTLPNPTSGYQEGVGVLVTPAVTPSYAGVACPLSDKVDLCGTNYPCSGCPQYRSYFKSYPQEARLLEAIMRTESSCKSSAQSAAGAYGIMQMLPEVANRHRQECGIYKLDHEGKPIRNSKTGAFEYETITPSWLMNSENIEKNICLAVMEIRAIRGVCGDDYRDIAAGYNSGPGWCKVSRDCSQIPSCNGGPMLAWECPWDDKYHLSCNENRVAGSLLETKRYAPKVNALATCTTLK